MQQGAKSATAPPTKLASKLVPIRRSRTRRNYYSMSGPREARDTLRAGPRRVMRRVSLVVALLVIAAIAALSWRGLTFDGSRSSHRRARLEQRKGGASHRARRRLWGLRCSYTA